MQPRRVASIQAVLLGLTRRVGAALALAMLLAATAASADTTIIDRLRGGGHVLLMRHATAPGTGDPAGFRLGDCSTQRNLDQRGRQEAQRIGARLRSDRIPVARVYASRWCRARDTATLIDAGPVADAPNALDSFFGNRGEAAASTAALRRLLADLPQDAANTVMVTHQVNVTALTGIFPASSDIVVLRAGPFDPATSIVGRLRLD